MSGPLVSSFSKYYQILYIEVDNSQNGAKRRNLKVVILFLFLRAFIAWCAPSLVSRRYNLWFSDTVDGGVDENLVVDVVYTNTLCQPLQVLLRSGKTRTCQLLKWKAKAIHIFYISKGGQICM